ncbi:hypothetical protein FACS189483_01700 [Spirochaetia bacterium]|nr:hypothetical protein FACS189483_01700 [Spirochaetia bacterium]
MDAPRVTKSGRVPLPIEGRGKPEGCKLLRLSAVLEDGEEPVIRSIRIRGDFFASPEEGFDAVETLLAGTCLRDVAAVFDRLLAEGGVEVSGITGAGVAAVLRDALEKMAGKGSDEQ